MADEGFKRIITDVLKAHLLNYKYEIYSTKLQRYHLFKILRHARIQWNRAVTIRKKLKCASNSTSLLGKSSVVENYVIAASFFIFEAILSRGFDRFGHIIK